MPNKKYKKLLVVCGTGIATSTIVSRKVKDILNQRGIYNFYIKQSSLAQVPSEVSHYDLLITVSNHKKAYDIPSVDGVCFLTGVRKEEAINKIVKIVNED